jgi:hypothetical protein
MGLRSGPGRLLAALALAACPVVITCIQGGEPEDPASAAQDLRSLESEKDLREMATRWHMKAQQTRAWGDYNIARLAYAKYLRAFRDSGYSYRLRWFYADVLSKMMDYSNAAEQYARVRDQMPRGAYRDEAAWEVAWCWSECIRLRDNRDLDCRDWNADTWREHFHANDANSILSRVISWSFGESKLDTREIRLPFFERKLVQAVEVYARIAPDNEMVASSLLKTALIFYRYHQFARLSEACAEIVRRYPETESALNAARFLVNLPRGFARISKNEVDEKRHWAEVRQQASALRQNKAFMGSSHVKTAGFEKTLEELERESSEHLD